MTRELSPEAIDYLLHNRLDLRKEVELIGPHSTGLVRIPARGSRPGSQVEFVAIERAELTTVLDAVDRGWQALTPDLREVARAKYGRRHMRNYEVETRYHLSRATVSRKLSTIRAIVAGYLSFVPEATLRHFWLKIGSLLEDSVRQA